MAYSIQVSGQLIAKQQNQTPISIDSSMVELERRELCSGSLFKQGKYDYFYYFYAITPQGTFKWLVNVSSSPELTQITHSHLYKYPKELEIEQDVEFVVSEVRESKEQYQVDLQAS